MVRKQHCILSVIGFASLILAMALLPSVGISAQVAPGSDLQQALDAAPNGATLELLPGDHLGPLVIDGRTNITIRAIPGGGVATLIHAGKTTPIITLKNSSNITIENIAVTQTNCFQHDTVSAVRIEASDSITLRGNDIYWFGLHGVEVRGPGASSNILIADNIISQNLTHVASPSSAITLGEFDGSVSVSNAIIIGNLIRSVADRGITLHNNVAAAAYNNVLSDIGSNGLMIYGNDATQAAQLPQAFYGNVITEVPYGAHIFGSALLADNVFFDIDHDAVNLSDRSSEGLAPLLHVGIVNNTFGHTTTGIHTAEGFEVAASRAATLNKPITIGNNAIYAVDAFHLESLASGPGPTAASMGNNIGRGGLQGNVTLTQAQYEQSPNDPRTDFEGYDALNLMPTAGSYLIDRGIDLSFLFNFDFDGAPRTGAWDVGAYERNANHSQPTWFVRGECAKGGGFCMPTRQPRSCDSGSNNNDAPDQNTGRQQIQAVSSTGCGALSVSAESGGPALPAFLMIIGVALGWAVLRYQYYSF